MISYHQPMSKQSIIIGLTGNIGAGKSEILRLAQQRGARVIDADKVAHQVMTPGGRAYAAVAAAFGREVMQPDGTIDRVGLGRIVFSNPDRLATLEHIVHPAVIEAIRREIEAAPEPVIVIEAIKLLESGISSALCDQVWVVTSPVEQQIVRLMQSRGMSRTEAEARMATQSPQAFKISQADVILDNSGTLDALATQFEAAWQRLDLLQPV